MTKSQAKKAMDAVANMTKEERDALRKKLDEFEAEIEEVVGDIVDTVKEKCNCSGTEENSSDNSNETDSTADSEKNDEQDNL